MLETSSISITKTLETRVKTFDKNLQFSKEYSDHMFIADYKEGEWKNARIEPFRNLSISPANLAIHYGQSIFEGLKAYRYKDGRIAIFRPKENYERMNISAKRMVMPNIPEKIFMNGLKELVNLDRNWVPDLPGTSLYIRPFMFGTDEHIGVRASHDYTFIIITTPAGAYYANPLKVKVETSFTRAAKGGVGFAKTAGNYAASLYPTMLAMKEGYDQLIWTDGKNHEFVEESGAMNIAFIIEDTLVTTPISDTILSGITRNSLLTLTKTLGFKIEERYISVTELEEKLRNRKIKEVFGVGTAATIAPISLIAVNGTEYKLNDSERQFSKKIARIFSDIQLGRVEDKHEWNYYV